MKLSVIITSHNEGLLLHKALLSVQCALKQLPPDQSEIIINVDNGDKETLEFLASHNAADTYKIRRTHFGDVGRARFIKFTNRC